MNRQTIERNHWQVIALDVDVERKYISSMNDTERKKTLGDLKGRVLEIGCGTGRLLKPNWFGIDISQNMLDLAKQKRADCNFLLSDGRTIPYEDNYFNCVYCVLVFQHIPFDGFLQYVQETARVLKDGGQFTFQIIIGTEDEPFSHHYDIKKVLKTLKDAGFTVISQKRGLCHEQWTWINAIKGGNEAFKEVNLKEKK